MSRDSGDTWRVFCAIDLPGNLKEQLNARITFLREHVAQTQASWTRPDSIHLTLKFLGETPQSRIDSLSLATSESATGLGRFKILAQQCGSFPRTGVPRVLWIGIDDPEERLVELHSRLEDACAQAGFSREARPFHPHLTLARIRRPQGARRLAEAHRELAFTPVEFEVSELLVIRSELGKEGSKYTTISRHALSEAK